MRNSMFRPVLLVLVAGLAACGGASSDTAEKAAETPVIEETPQAYREYAAQLRHEGKHQEAADAALKAFTLARSGPRVDERIELAKAFGAGGNSAGAINEIKELEGLKRDGEIQLDEVVIAEVYAQIGDPNAVFRWLDRAIAANSPNVAGIETNEDLKPVHDDPRWPDIVTASKQ